MLVVGDKLRLINDIGMLSEGDSFKVTNIAENGFITFCNYRGFGVITPEELERYFTIVKPLKWTPWIQVFDKRGAFTYRTNHKKVEVKKNGLKSDSSCHPTDVFDLDMGIDICLARIEFKAAYKKLSYILSRTK